MDLESWPFRYVGLPLVAREDALREMEHMGLDYDRVQEILERGEPTGFERAEGTVERAMRIKDRWIKVVVKQSWDDFFERPVWRIVHVGRDTHGR